MTTPTQTSAQQQVAVRKALQELIAKAQSARDLYLPVERERVTFVLRACNEIRLMADALMDDLENDLEYMDSPESDRKALAKLKNAQEERRARQTTIDGDVIELDEELGLDVELAEAEAARNP
jgi:hypothetical protein